MKIEDIIELTRAGFTKDDIIKLVSKEAPAEPEKKEAPAAAASAPDPEPENKEAPAAASAEDIGVVISQKISEAFKPFEDLYNNIAVKANMPTIGNIQPKGLDDIIDSFFN